MNENNCQPRIVCPVKVSVRNEDKNKDVSTQLSWLQQTVTKQNSKICGLG